MPKIQIRGQPIPPGAGIPPAKRQVIGPRPGQPMHIQRGRAVSITVISKACMEDYTSDAAKYN